MATTKIVNLTPHAIDVFDARGNLVCTFKPATSDKNMLRVAEKNSNLAPLNIELDDDRIVDVPFVEKTMIAPVSLPPWKACTYYLVSLPFAQALLSEGTYRDDILVIGEYVRDHDGNVKGCSSLARLRKFASANVVWQREYNKYIFYKPMPWVYDDQDTLLKSGGWYFWDESGAHAMGPFPTEAQVKLAFLAYTP